MDEVNRWPDPSGPPRPVAEGPVRETAVAVARTLGWLAVWGGGAAAVLGLVSATCMPTMGSTRSVRLKWRERQRQAESAASAAPFPSDRR